MRQKTGRHTKTSRLHVCALLPPSFRKQFPFIYPFSGTVQAVKYVDVIPRVTGYITERKFVEGSIVEKDQWLYEIDPRPFQAALDVVEADLTRSECATHLLDG